MSRPNDQWIARYDEAVYQLALGNVDQCIAELRAILVDYPDCLDAQLALGNAHLRKEELQEALQETLKAVEMEPENQMAQMNLSIIYMRMGDKEKAEHHALQAKLIYWKKSGKEPPPSCGKPHGRVWTSWARTLPTADDLHQRNRSGEPRNSQKPETES